MKKENTKDRSALFLKSLRLDGFRGFYDGTVIDFTDDKGNPAQWTVILGENGTSKTGILQALAALAPNVDDVRKNEQEIETDYWRPFYANDTGLKWLSQNLARKRELNKLKLSCEFFLSEAGLTKNAGRNLPNDWYLELRKQPDANNRFSFNFNALREDLISEPVIVTYGSSRITDDNSQLDRNLSSLFDNFDKVNSPEQWLLELDHARRMGAEGEADRAKEAFESAIRCITAVLPDVDDVKIEKTSEIWVTPKIRAKFQTPYGWVFFEELGQGYQSIASWTIDLIQQLHKVYPDRKKPETGPAVVLVDEFDLHLHPKWQLTLMDHLSQIFTNTQFIITAHSPLIVQAAGPNTNLVVLKRETDKDGENWIVADSDPVCVRGWRLDQIITSDLFGLSSVRPARYEELFSQRSALLAKPDRNKKEDEELRNITETLKHEAPPSISQEANDILRELEALEK